MTDEQKQDRRPWQGVKLSTEDFAEAKSGNILGDFTSYRSVGLS